MELELTEELIGRQSTEAQAIIRLLLARIAALEFRLGMTPQNSSLPPSSVHPHAKATRKKRKSKRHRGGQSGHPKAERELIRVEDCTEVVPLMGSDGDTPLVGPFDFRSRGATASESPTFLRGVARPIKKNESRRDGTQGHQ